MIEKNATKSLPARYLPFEKFHIAPITDITPDALKRSAKATRTKYKDREDIKLTACQNYIAKSLGFSGGFDGYQKDYLRSLRPFLVKEGLSRRADLISPRHPFSIFCLNPRQIADRLFVAESVLPRRIFTGYDVNWEEMNNSFFGWNNPWLQNRDSFTHQNFLDALARDNWSLKLSPSEILAAAVEAKRNDLFPWDNLLGDQLLEMDGNPFSAESAFPTCYFSKEYAAEERKADMNRYREALQIFRYWSDSSPHGWVEVIPYNNRLIFLKGRDGEYDFFFPGLRNTLFDHNPYEPYLKNADTPKSNDTYHFRRWRYFEYKGWEEMEAHESEQAHYGGGGDATDHPGSEECLRRHLIRKGKYTPPEKTASLADGYTSHHVCGLPMFISNLITVKQFREFMHQSREYADYRRKGKKIDCWETVNLETDSFLPAAVTWYDANAYAAWVSKTKGLPVRLLTEDEYAAIARPLIPASKISLDKFYSMGHQRICRFFLPDGTLVEGHPPYMEESDFQNLLFGYISKAVKWVKAESGLTFLVSPHFGEWLNQEGAAVNTSTLSALCDPEATPYRAPFAARSTGKYKSKKVGFRLCYLGKL